MAEAVIVPKVVPAPEFLNTKAENMVAEWDFWSRSFERFCRMSKLTADNDKVDAFYTYVGRETEEYLRNLPDFGTLKTVEDLLKKVKAKYTRAPNVLCERFNFRQVKILPNESIADFNDRLNSFF